MYKHIFKFILIAFVTITFTNCDDFLTHEEKGEPSMAVMWRTEADAYDAADGLYFWSTIEGIVGRGMMWYVNVSDDMVTGRSQSDAANLKNFQYGRRDNERNWPVMYQLIKKANDVINNVPDMDISQDVKNKVLGQAYFFRGWAYLWLAPYYGDNGENGGLPIVTEDTPFDEMNQPRAKTVSENYEMIISDMDKAAEMLPYLKDWDESQWGRPHKTAAWAHAAKAALYNAQYDNSYYQKVVDYCDLVIPHHKLLNNYADVFKMEHNFSSEYVYGWTGNEKDGSKLPGVMLENKGWGKYNGWGYFMPTKNLYDAFEPNDERRAVTILAPGDEFTFFGENRVYYSTQSSSGMQFNKYMDPFRPVDAQGTTLNPNGNYMTTRLIIPLVRFSEVLLWKAEALIWQDKNGDEPFNLVRTRAGLDPITGATKADLKLERRLELAAEFTNRHLDLVRWGDAKEAYSKALYGYETVGVTEADDKEAIISKTKVIEVWPARNFDPSINHVFPIPPSVVDASQGVIKQNKGY